MIILLMMLVGGGIDHGESTCKRCGHKFTLEEYYNLRPQENVYNKTKISPLEDTTKNDKESKIIEKVKEDSIANRVVRDTGNIEDEIEVRLMQILLESSIKSGKTISEIMVIMTDKTAKIVEKIYGGKK